MKKIQLPLSEKELKNLKAGDEVLISGVIYTARDAAHQKLCSLIKENKSLPLSLDNACFYYTGPTPSKPNMIVGSIGPTSSYRMDKYCEPLLDKGLKIMIGKGERSEDFIKLLPKYNAIYIFAIGGVGALDSQKVKKCELVAYPELGAEAIYRLEIEDFYGIVYYDALGGRLK